MSYDLNGKYPATLGKGVLTEAKSGALMYYVEVNIENVPPLRGQFCLVKKDGEMMQRNVENLIAVLDGRWDGTDIAALEAVDPTGLACVAEAVDGAPSLSDGKIYTEIKNVYPPNGGGGQKLPEAVDAKSVAAKYGSKFRAAFGGKSAVATKPAPAPAGKKAPPPPSAPRAATPTPAPAGKASTMNACWAELNAKLDGTADIEIADQWNKMLAAKFPGTDTTALTPAQWGEVSAFIEAMDTDPTPF